jgi:hypothetical protein
MHRCLKIAIKPSREIRWLCFNAGKLFNCANYLIKTGSAKLISTTFTINSLLTSSNLTYIPKPHSKYSLMLSEVG